MAPKRKTSTSASSAEKAEKEKQKHLASMSSSIAATEQETEALLRLDINKLLDDKPEVVSHKVSFHLQRGTYENTNAKGDDETDNNDWLASSSNTWALMSRNNLYDLIRRSDMLSTSGLAALSKSRGKKMLVAIIVFGLHTKPSSHLYSKYMLALVEAVRKRFAEMGSITLNLQFNNDGIDWSKYGYYQLVSNASGIAQSIKSAFGPTTDLPSNWKRADVSIMQNDTMDASLRAGLDRLFIPDLFKQASVALPNMEVLDVVPEGQRIARSPGGVASTPPTTKRSRFNSPSAASSSSRIAQTPPGFGGAIARDIGGELESAAARAAEGAEESQQPTA